MADVLAMPELMHGEPLVLAGHDALQQPVRWTHVAEIAGIAPLLRGGELVLTTGIALPDDPDLLDRYVTELRHAGAVGLVIELGHHWTSSLPNALVDACKREQLPLVALRREIRFVALTQAVGERIVDAQVVELRAAEQIHETFTKLTVAEAGPTEILAEAARIAAAPVVLESFRHEVLGYHSAGQAAHHLLHDWTQRSRRARIDGRTGYCPDNGWLMTVVGSRGDDWGRLVLVSPAPPPHRHVVVVERAAAALAVHRLHARHRDSIERQAHHSLLAALRARDIDEDLLARCAQGGVPLTDRSLIGLAARPRLQPDHQTFATADAVSALAAAVASVLRKREISALIAGEEDAVVALLSLSPDADPDEILIKIAADLRSPGEVLIGVGETARRPVDAGRSLADAHHVVAALPAGARPHRFHRLADVHLRGLLHLLSGDDRLRRFAQRELGPLLEHDAENHADLLDVLRALVSTPDKTAASAALHISRPVFYQRIKRIESILGVDLDQAEIRTSLHTALLAHDLTHAV